MTKPTLWILLLFGAAFCAHGVAHGWIIWPTDAIVVPCPKWEEETNQEWA